MCRPYLFATLISLVGITLATAGDEHAINPIAGSGWLTTPGSTLFDPETVQRLQRCRQNLTSIISRTVTKGYNSDTKIAIISAHSGNYMHGSRGSYVTAGLKVTRKYCKKWNCDVIEVVNNMTDGRCIYLDGASELVSMATHPSWCKVLVVRHFMQQGLYDYYIWLDADAAIVDQTFDVRALFASYPDKEFFASREHFKMYDLHWFNAGIWAIKKSEVMLMMLTEWWNQVANDTYAAQRDGWDMEQRPLNMYLRFKYAPRIADLSWCFMYDHPVHVLDRGWLIHMPNISPVKVADKVMYLSFWDSMYPD